MLRTGFKLGLVFGCCLCAVVQAETKPTNLPAARSGARPRLVAPPRFPAAPSAVEQADESRLKFTGGAAPSGGPATLADRSHLQQATHLNPSGIDAQYRPSTRRGGVASRLKAIRRSVIVTDPIPDPAGAVADSTDPANRYPAPLVVELEPPATSAADLSDVGSPEPLQVIDPLPSAVTNSTPQAPSLLTAEPVDALPSVYSDEAPSSNLARPNPPRSSGNVKSYPKTDSQRSELDEAGPILSARREQFFRVDPIRTGESNVPHHGEGAADAARPSSRRVRNQSTDVAIPAAVSSPTLSGIEPMADSDDGLPTTGVAREVASEAAAKVAAEAAPKVAPDAAPTVVTAEVAPEAAAKVTPAAAPKVTAEVAPDVKDDVVTEVASKSGIAIPPTSTWNQSRSASTNETPGRTEKRRSLSPTSTAAEDGNGLAQQPRPIASRSPAAPRTSGTETGWETGVIEQPTTAPTATSHVATTAEAGSASPEPMTVEAAGQGLASLPERTEAISASERIAPFTLTPGTETPAASAPAEAVSETAETGPTHTLAPSEPLSLDGEPVEPNEPNEPAKPIPAADNPAADNPVADNPVADNVLFANESPVLSVQTRGPRTIKVGRPAIYDVEMVNASDYGAQDVVIKLVVPSWAEAAHHEVSAGAVVSTPDEQGNSVLSWTIRQLAGDSRESMRLELIPRTSRPFDLGISWTFTPASSLTQIEVLEAKLQMSIVGPADVLFGETKLYTIMISNPGTGDAENVVLSLLPISDGQGTPGVREMGTLKAGTRRSIEVELTAHQAGRLMVRAQASADGGLQSQADQEVLVRRANLEIEIADGGAPAQYAGTSARYAIRVTNTGDATARDVSAVAALPTGAKYVSSTDGGAYDAASSKVSWAMDALRPGAVQIFEMVCVLNEAGKNRIDVRAKADDQLTAAGSITTHVESLADLKLLVNDPQGAIPVGTEMIYEVRIVNRGTKEARNIDVMGYFSEGIEPTAVRGWRADVEVGQVIFEQIPRLGPGQEMIVKVAAQAHRPGDHVFRAELESTDPETKLAVEEWTRFFGEPSTPRHANRDNGAIPETLPPERLEGRR